MNSQRLSFTNANNYDLSARLELPIDKGIRAYAIFAHCFTCTKNLSAVRNISRALTQQGFAVLRFDFTGLGESDGDFEDTNFTSNVEDLLAAARFLERNYEAPRLIVGHSLGGAAVIAAAQVIDSIEAVATIGAPATPDHVSHLFKSSLDEINTTGKAQVNIGGRTFHIKKQFIEDIHAVDLKITTKQLRKPLLILHSPQDFIVGIENAEQIYMNAHHPKSFVSLDGADHLLSRKRDSEYVGKVIAGWSERYISLPEANDLKAQDQVSVQIGKDGYTTQIKAGRHSLIADEPASVGGEDLGLSPYDLLLASLGACTVMTLRMYADRKQWPLDEVTVHLKHEKKHADDCVECEKPSARLDHIYRDIEIKGTLDDKQRARLLEIADRCPVHRTLHSEIRVVTSAQ